MPASRFTLNAMSSAAIIALGLGFAFDASAGIEVVLLEQQYGDCTVRVTHDATPDSKIGTIDFRAYTMTEGVHIDCEIDRRQVAASLGQGISRYLSKPDLKPVTSVFVGKIADFPWIRAAWSKMGHSGSHPRLSHREFNRMVMEPDLSAPFRQALEQNGLALTGASCEKLQFHENGAPMDALCWFEIGTQ